MTFDTPGTGLDLLRQAEQTPTVEHQLAIALHRLQTTAEGFFLIGLHTQTIRQGCDLNRFTRRFNQLQQIFPAGHRLLVLFTLPIQERILPTQAFLPAFFVCFMPTRFGGHGIHLNRSAGIFPICH